MSAFITPGSVTCLSLFDKRLLGNGLGINCLAEALILFFGSNVVNEYMRGGLTLMYEFGYFLFLIAIGYLIRAYHSEILAEEYRLQRRYGPASQVYCQKVPRYLLGAILKNE